MLRIPYGRQSINEADIEAVVEVLRSDWLTQGPAIERFEQAVADYCGAKYAVAVNSATSALHLAALAAGLETDNLLWTSPNTFVASANCGLYCGANVDFVDIDPRTYNLSLEKLAEKLHNGKIYNQLPQVIIPVHFAGQPVPMRELYELVSDYEITIIEDAAHAIGGSYLEQKIGNCQYSEMTVFSFHPVKIITSGEGGIITTNREDLYEKLIRLRSHGITRKQELMTEPAHGPWYYQQIELGFNYRMTDIQAALGYSQLQRIDRFVARRRELAERYNRLLAGLPLILPWQHPDSLSAYHLYVIRLQTGVLRKSHRQIFEELQQLGIGVNLHYIPVHLQPYYRRLGFREGDFPEAERYYQEAISLPIYYELTDSQQDQVIAALNQVIA